MLALRIILLSCGIFEIIRTTTGKRNAKNFAVLRDMLFNQYLQHGRQAYDLESQIQDLEHASQPQQLQKTTKGNTHDPDSHLNVEGRSIVGLLGLAFSGALKTLRKPLVQYFSGTGKQHNRNQTCFDGYGCFYYKDNMSLPIGPPERPEKLQTTFYFFTNNSRADMEDLLNENKTGTYPSKTWTLENWTYSYMKETLNTSWPLMVLTHGFLGNKRTVWMLPVVKALLDNITCTVLVIDWELGANGSYRDVAMNSPMVGVLISMFLQKIIKETSCAIRPENITLIGFSLGAHIMGFAGRHFHNASGMLLGRISGLDPAGYLFDYNTAALSKEDAQYVDVIHTHGGSMEDFKLGLSKQIGHVDFYPNGGSWQPGCYKYPTTSQFIASLMCSHYRAAFLFAESLTNLGCSFTSYHCDKIEDYKDCKRNATQEDIGLMGYYSFRARGRGRQYLETKNKPPYCLGNNSAPPDNYNYGETLIGAVFGG